jgi:hypothetical protein
MNPCLHDLHDDGGGTDIPSHRRIPQSHPQGVQPGVLQDTQVPTQRVAFNTGQERASQVEVPATRSRRVLSHPGTSPTQKGVAESAKGVCHVGNTITSPRTTHRPYR